MPSVADRASALADAPILSVEIAGLLLTSDEAGRYLGLSRTTFHKLKSERLLPAPRRLPGPNCEDRYLRADLDEWARKLPRRDDGGTR